MNTTKSAVFYIDFHSTLKENVFTRLEKLVKSAGIEHTVQKRDLTAVKLHFGELGNTAYIRPVYIRKIVDILKSLGAQPFLTDANTLYSGSRSDAPNHLLTALHNGFGPACVDAPLIIADGLRGKSEVEIEIQKKHCKNVYIAKEIMEADSIICVSHFKGHELSGFGGALKNLGMGSASRRGKLAQHSTVSPAIEKASCIGCGECISHCSQQAIALHTDKAEITSKRCIGCGECILVCPQKAVQIEWDQSIPVFMEKMIEYSYAIHKEKKGRIFYITFVIDVSPACDCYGFNDIPLVKNIGIFASLDPVAIDQACADCVTNEPALPDSCIGLKNGHNKAGEDKFKGVYPSVDWEIQLAYAENIGIGNRAYSLIKI